MEESIQLKEASNLSKTPSYTSNLLSRGHRQSMMKRRRSRLTSWDLHGSHDLLEQEHDLAFIRSVVKLQRVQCPVESPPPTPRAPRGSLLPTRLRAALAAVTEPLLAHPFFPHAPRAERQPGSSCPHGCVLLSPP